MVMRGAGLFALGCLLAGPALADDEPTRLEHFVMLVAGIGDGATVNVSHGAVARVTRLGPGRYEVVVDESGGTLGFAASEPEPCVLQLAITTADHQMGGGIRLDLNRVTGMDIHPLKGEVPTHVFVTTGAAYAGPLNGIAVVIEQAGAALEASEDGVNFLPMTPHTTFITSLSVEDLQAAFAALHTECPGPGT